MEQRRAQRECNVARRKLSDGACLRERCSRTSFWACSLRRRSGEGPCASQLRLAARSSRPHGAIERAKPGSCAVFIRAASRRGGKRTWLSSRSTSTTVETGPPDPRRPQLGGRRDRARLPHAGGQRRPPRSGRRARARRSLSARVLDVRFPRAIPRGKRLRRPAQGLPRIHAQRDYYVPVAQSIEMAKRLERRGKEVALVT